MDIESSSTNSILITTEPPIISKHVYPLNLAYTAAAFGILFVVVGTVGNLITIVALFKCMKLRNVTTAFVINLSISDLIFCSFSLPLFVAEYINQKQIFDELFCKIYPYFFYGNLGASLMAMLAITINRYVLIVHNQCFQISYRKPLVTLMIFICWLFPFSLLTPALFNAWGKFSYNEATCTCTIMETNGQSPKITVFILAFFMPAFVIVICYSRIFWVVRRVKRSLDKLSPHIARHRRNDIRLTRTMSVIFFVFIITFLPTMAANVFDEDINYPAFHILSAILAWMSSCANPIIYAVMNRQYRQAYSALLPCKKLKIGKDHHHTDWSSSFKTPESNESPVSVKPLSTLFTVNNVKYVSP